MAAVHSMRPKKQGPESLVLIAWIKRQLNRGSPSNETQKTKADCHCRCIFDSQGFLIRTALFFLRSGADQKPLASEDVAGVAQ